jgi:hypothetical protein
VLSVYARTTTTRRLLTNGRHAYVFSRPVVRRSVEDWHFLGYARDFASANDLTRSQAAKDAAASGVVETQAITGVDIVGHLTLDTTQSSVFQASDFGGRLQWYEYTAAVPLEGWTPLGGPR